MAVNNVENNLKQCLQILIRNIHEPITEFEILKDRSGDYSSLSYYLDTFTLNDEEEEAIDEIKTNLENLLNEHLPSLVDHCRKYLFNLLYQYEYDEEKHRFNNTFNLSVLLSLERDLQSAFASIDAFQAAWNGNQSAVEKFVENHPTLKDKPGLWGTTLLYSAAKNNHQEIVQYLIETAKCSVDAQNEQNLEKILATSTKKTASQFEVNTKAASTALHGACFNGHLNIVKYLVEHSANYFIRNQAEETPIMNSESHRDIREYFKTILILGYSSVSKTLPDKPILDEISQQIDCIWEYKPFSDDKWYSFSTNEIDELQQSLLVTSDEKFKTEVRLVVDRGIYNVSTIQFVRSGKDENKDNNLAWVRCRGSSILNFDCYSMWQIMFIKHPQVKSPSTSSLQISHIPIIYDKNFEIQLNCWYVCDENTNSELDHAMDYRRKLSHLNLDLISDKEILFDLQTFSLYNQQKTIVGFIRWIPKLISNNEQNRIVYVDNYGNLTNLNPIPLTRKRLQQITQTTDSSLSLDEELLGDDLTALGLVNDIKEDDKESLINSEMTTKSSNEGLWSMNDTKNDDDDDDTISSNGDFDEEQNRLVSTRKTNESSDDAQDINIDDYLDPSADDLPPTDEPQVTETATSADNDPITEPLLEGLKRDIKEINNHRDIEKKKVQQQSNLSAKEAAKNAQKLSETLQRIDQLNAELADLTKKEEKIKQMQSTIKVVIYKNLEEDIVSNFLMPKFALILNCLKRKSKHLDDYFLDKLPQMIFEKKQQKYHVTISGLQIHHQTFKDILQRLLILANVKQRALEFYQRHLKRITKSIHQILFQVRSYAKHWKQFSKFFYELLKENSSRHLTLFKDYIGQKTIELSEACILGDSISPWTAIRNETDSFMEENPFTNEIKQLKYQALEKFIEQNISFQRIKLEKKPSDKSIATIEFFIRKIKKIFTSDKKYIGHKLKHFRLIPHLLQRLMIYYACFTIQLPLYESARKLLDEIEANTVITIATSTGSGKSTLLPALLIAEGYDKVIVTQPRRLPCKTISDRVNTTMLTDTNPRAEKLSGWAVSGEATNSNAKILYLTDGLLKERLLKEKHFLTANTPIHKSIVLFIDEVHERSVNIDLCLALIARMLTYQPELRKKVKVIISSATLDSSVTKLFRKKFDKEFSEFTMPTMGTLYRVDRFYRPNENIINIVQELYRKRQRHDQILCFVNSVTEVNQCCRLLLDISQNTIVAYPLVQSQPEILQKSSIENGSVFFSTTVAETSLTFPSLKYVIDTGIINIPKYDLNCKRTVLTEVRAAESTLKQRLGRLGRTKPGEYYGLYNPDTKRDPFPTAQICQSDLVSIEFSLRTSWLQDGLNHLKEFLPDPPKQAAIDFTILELIQMGILGPDPHNHLTNYGKSLSKLPDFGSVSMARCVLAALVEYRCGRDLICLASILSVLNTTAVFKRLPQNVRSPNGDFMTLLNVMNEILLVKQSVQPREFNLARVCQEKGLTDIKHIIKQALKRYSGLEKFFDFSDVYRQDAQIKCGKWEFIARALLTGYSGNVFVSLKELQDRTHHFRRYNDSNDITVLDLKSTLTRSISQTPVSIVLARDILYLTAIRSTGVMSFVGELKAEWLDYVLQRDIKLSSDEENYLNMNNKYSNARSMFSNRISMKLNNQILSLKGPAGVVLNTELHFLQELTVETKFSLENNNPMNSTAYENLSRNLESVMKMSQIFRPMIWRWEAQKQVKITVNSNTATKTCEITVRGKYSQIQEVKDEFDSFLSWLQDCAVIRHPNAGVSPRLLRSQMRKDCEDIEERISHVTDPKRTPIDLYNSVKGLKATRETRMEVVAWIAVCKFGCKLEGGFVRDWIVGKHISPRSKLPNDPRSWIDYHTNKQNKQIPSIKPEVVPGDLDCHLPTRAYFDIDKFQDELHRFDIKCTVHRENWRYVLLIDEYERTGPFTMDLIEPHVALTHDRIDFDVSNLVLEKKYTRDLGMRIDIQQKPYLIELETIVENIKNKRFQVLRPIDQRMNVRLNKMINIRHWQQLGEPFSVIPNPHPHHYTVLVPLHHSSTLYQILAQKMKLIDHFSRIVSVEQIKNPYLEDAYEAMKKIIAKQCERFDPKEWELFHGTSGDGIKGIIEDGFDDRFFNPDGAWGHGAYFAEDPRKSHNYTDIDPIDQTRVMFYNKVLLGKQSIQANADRTLVSAPRGYHSVKGTYFHYMEYIIYRYGQALPYLKIIYKA